MLSRILLLLVVTLSLAACSKLTKENYNALELGMSEAEITAILGGADNCSESLGTKSCIWGDEESKYIKVRFVADVAAMYSSEGLE